MISLICIVLTGSSESVHPTNSGPCRTRRGKRERTAQQPYPVQEGANLNGGGCPPKARRSAILRQPALLGRPRCQRGGVPLHVQAPTAGNAQLLWDTNPLDAPSHSAHLMVTRFLGLLTSNLTDSAASACAAQIQHAAQHLCNEEGARSLSVTVEQCAAAFRFNNASNFTLMMRLIQLKSQICR